MKSKKVFVFLPETGMYPYFRTLLSAAECIGKDSDIICLKCSGQFETCTCLASCNKLNCNENEKKMICSNCSTLLQKAQQEYNFSFIDLDEIFSLEKRTELEDFIPEKIEDCYGFKYKNFEVGQIAIYDLVLATKILDINKLSDEHKQLYRRYLLNTIIALEICDYVAKTCNPDVILAFNPYSECQAAKFIAQQYGIKFEFLTNVSHMGADYSRYYFSKEFMITDWNTICQSWNNYSSIPLLNEYVKLSWDDSLYRSFGTGSHIFSNSKDTKPNTILESLGLKKNKKTLVAFTSSNDEFIGVDIFTKIWNIKDASKDVFSNTLEWLRFLKSYSEKHSDVQIIVRVHPREGKRQGGKPSEHLLLLQNEFKENSENFVIVWSDDPISSYDLIELADGVLVTLSTMAQESARVGIPILSTVTGKYYSNASFMHIADDIEDYEEKLNNLVNEDYSYNMLRDAIRYNYWRNFIQSMDFSDTIPHDFNNTSIWPHICKEKADLVYKVCVDNENLIGINLKNWEAKINETTEVEEKIAIAEGIARYINRIMISPKKMNKYFIYFLKVINKIIRIVSLRKININLISWISGKRKQPELQLLLKPVKNNKNCSLLEFGEKNEIVFSYKNFTEKRYSPQLYRLAKIYEGIMKEGVECTSQS